MIISILNIINIIINIDSRREAAGLLNVRSQNDCVHASVRPSDAHTSVVIRCSKCHFWDDFRVIFRFWDFACRHVKNFMIFIEICVNAGEISLKKSQKLTRRDERGRMDMDERTWTDGHSRLEFPHLMRFLHQCGRRRFAAGPWSRTTLISQILLQQYLL